MNTSEPVNFIGYGALAIVFIVLAIAGYYFFRNTIEKKDWKMFVWAGIVGLLVAGLFIYTTYL